tara:strand:+ start:347 stop:550 length:204 start_codon:yes stop_codon:yes gene_type:complete
MKKEKAYKKVNEISDHHKYQLQHFHGTLFDYAYKVTHFIASEVDTKLGNDLLERLWIIQKATNNNKT